VCTFFLSFGFRMSAHPAPVAQTDAAAQTLSTEQGHDLEHLLHEEMASPRDSEEDSDEESTAHRSASVGLYRDPTLLDDSQSLLSARIATMGSNSSESVTSYLPRPAGETQAVQDAREVEVHLQSCEFVLSPLMLD
jgi:hypothetical protein